jgi:hypothetical protein
MTREEIKEVVGIISYMIDNCTNTINIEDLINDEKSTDEIPKLWDIPKLCDKASKAVDKALDKCSTTQISELFDDADDREYTFDDIFDANDRDCIMKLTDERYRPRSRYVKSRGKYHHKYYTVKDHRKRPRSMLTKNQLEMLDIIERATGKRYFV